MDKSKYKLIVEENIKAKFDPEIERKVRQRESRTLSGSLALFQIPFVYGLYREGYERGIFDGTILETPHIGLIVAGISSLPYLINEYKALKEGIQAKVLSKKRNGDLESLTEFEDKATSELGYESSVLRHDEPTDRMPLRFIFSDENILMNLPRIRTAGYRSNYFPNKNIIN